MAHTKPTPENLKDRYPAFAAVDDLAVQIWLTDAERGVDESWLEADYAPAIMALAAHHMSLIGLGTGSIPSGVTKFKSAGFEATISDGIAGDKRFGSTVYGREYQLVLDRNKAGPRLVTST